MSARLATPGNRSAAFGCLGARIAVRSPEVFQ